MGKWPELSDLVGPDEADKWDSYRVEIPFLRSWPTDQVREHIATALRDQASHADTMEVPVPNAS